MRATPQAAVDRGLSASLKPLRPRADKHRMRIYLDDAACEHIQADSVAQAVDIAAALARAKGRTIVDIIVDGRRWDADRIDSPEARSRNIAKEVRLASADPRDIVCEAFSDAAQALGEIDDLQQAAAGMLQADKAADAMDRLGQAIDLWGSVHQAVTMGAAMAQLDLAPQRETIERLTSQLKSMRGALEQRDSVALADTLLYDLPDVVSEWRALLHTLRERVRDGGQVNGEPIANAGAKVCAKDGRKA
jgi:hypothetical protein